MRNLRNPLPQLRKGEVRFFKEIMGKVSAKRNGRKKHAGFWNERLLVFDSVAELSVKTMTFTETLAFPGSEVRTLLRRFPSGRERVLKLIVRRLWRLVLITIGIAARMKVYLRDIREGHDLPTASRKEEGFVGPLDSTTRGPPRQL